jgi:RNA polymerase sigma-70 factor (ECF subfamily)
VAARSKNSRRGSYGFLHRCSPISCGGFAEQGDATLGKLPNDYREVIILRQLEDLSFADVALRMQRSEDSVKNLWVRALARMRLAMEDPR